MKLPVKEILAATLDARAAKIVKKLKRLPHVLEAEVWAGDRPVLDGAQRLCLCGRVHFKDEDEPRAFTIPVRVSVGAAVKHRERLLDLLDWRIASVEDTLEAMCLKVTPRQADLFFTPEVVQIYLSTLTTRQHEA